MVLYQDASKTKSDNEPTTQDLAFCDFIRSTPSPPSGTVRLFDRGDFYCAYGPCAHFVAHTFFRTLTVLKYIGRPNYSSSSQPHSLTQPAKSSTSLNTTTNKNSKGYDLTYDKDGMLPSVALSVMPAKNFLREALTARQMRVEIWTTDEGGGGKGTGKGSGGKWKLSKQASPGNLQSLEDLLFSHSDMLVSPVLMSIKLSTNPSSKSAAGPSTSVAAAGTGTSSSGRNVVVGICFADTSSKEIGVAEFEDNEAFSNTESLVIQLDVKEVILPEEPVPKEPKLSKKAALAAEAKRAARLAEAKSKGIDVDAMEQDQDDDDEIMEVDAKKTNKSPKVDYEGRKLKAVLERCGVTIGEVKKSDFSGTDVEQDLNRLLKDKVAVAARPEFDMKIAMGATSALINYLSLSSDENNFSTFAFKTHDLKQYMRLDGSALKALNLMPDLSSGGASGMSGKGMNRNTSLFGLLNRCKTGQGTRLLAMWLKQPLVNQHEIIKRQNLVDWFFQDEETRSTLQDVHLKVQPDLHRISKRFQKKVANLEDVVRVYQALIRIPDLIDCLKSGFENFEYVGGEKNELERIVEEAWVGPLTSYNTDAEMYREMVEDTIDLDEISNHNFVLKPDFDPHLKEIKKKINAARSLIDKEHKKVANELGMDTTGKVLKFETHSQYGSCLRLTRNNDLSALNANGYHQYTTNKTGCYFNTYKAKKANEEITTLEAQFMRKQGSMVKHVIEIAASYSTILEPLNNVVAHLDVIASFAHVSRNAPISYIKPSVSPLGEGDLVFKESRHPCLEVQDDIEFISNDVEMKRGDSEFQIITGPNMGGKSTYIRQIGVIALMAQVGCFVPCSEAQIPIFDSILARVGAGDSQLKGVSTFMAEMLETATILKSATKDSLIIIDELGRGTSTYDGFGLAWAISEHIATEIHAFCLFASHFHELTALESEISHVKNLHVVCHVDQNLDSLIGKDVTLLYKVEKGFSDQSFGIHVAELAQFPEEVIKLAKRRADELEDFGGDEKVMTIDEKTTAEGVTLVESLIKEWLVKEQALGRDDDPNAMSLDDEGNAEDINICKLDLLKSCLREYQDRLQENEWTRQVLLESY